MRLFSFFFLPFLFFFPFWNNRRNAEKPRKYKGLNENSKIKREVPRWIRSLFWAPIFSAFLSFFHEVGLWEMGREWLENSFSFSSFLAFSYKKRRPWCSESSMIFSFSFYFREYPVLPFFMILGMKGIVSLHGMTL